MTEQQRRQLSESEDQAKKFASRQMRLAFDTPEGRYALGFIGVKLCNFMGRSETEEERVRRNVFCDILEVMGLGDQADQFEIISNFMSHPVR